MSQWGLLICLKFQLINGKSKKNSALQSPDPWVFDFNIDLSGLSVFLHCLPLRDVKINIYLQVCYSSQQNKNSKNYSCALKLLH